MSITIDAVVVLTPNAGTPNIDYPLPNGTLGVAYSQDIVATGGTAPYTFLVTGALPTGLVANQTAPDTLSITGTPTVEGGPVAFDVQATDNGGFVGHQQY